MTRTPNPGTAQRLLPALAAALLILAGCASPPAPDEMAVANAALSHAVAAGAPEFAAAELAAAREKMNRANQALADKDADRARALAQQVTLDAQLAEARAESEKARRSEAAVRDANGAVRDEISRQPN